MMRPNFRLVLPIVVAGVLPIAGCATKSYVRQQIAPVQNDLAAYKTYNDEKVAALAAKHDTDISQLNESLATTNMKLDQTTGTASRAMELSEANSAKLGTLTAGVANAMNYQMISQTEVNFGFNKYNLTKEARAALDGIASKARALPRFQVELAGFTDPIGSRSYNYALSVRRADAVQRYLVMRGVPLRSISTVGLGKNTPPPQFARAEKISTEGLTKAQMHAMSRRVVIQLLGAGNIVQGTASRSQ